MRQHPVKLFVNKNKPSIKGNNIIIDKLLKMEKKSRLLDKFQKQYLLMIPLPVWWI
jgi:hypothetical protein